MQSLLDALPGQPLSPEAVDALNDAASVRLIPYSWSGEQAITLLLDESHRLSGGRFEPPTAEPENTMGTTTSRDEDPIEFDTGTGGPLGTVEVVEPESLLPEDAPFLEVDDTDQQDNSDSDETARSDDAGSAGGDGNGQVTAVGYSTEETAWVVIDDLDPGSTLRDAEPLVREWLEDVYHEQMLDRIAVGPSEYELSDDSQSGP